MDDDLEEVLKEFYQCVRQKQAEGAWGKFVLEINMEQGVMRQSDLTVKVTRRGTPKYKPIARIAPNLS